MAQSNEPELHEKLEQVKVDKYPRRTFLRDIEAKYQAQWEDNKVFEANYDPSKETFFCTFPYPYMNGRLHIGHAFTVSKADFSAGFNRLIGKNVLFPFGFHCTGMPIQASANGLKHEIEKYGCPPVFPNEEETARIAAEKEAAKQAAKSAEQVALEATKKGKGKSGMKKAKLTAKTASAYKWQILERLGVPAEEIPKFQDPEHWLQYFPPLGVKDLKVFGLPVDWRRSFITTSTNKYYDSFIQWQFRTLRQRGVIDFGKRPTIYSVRDKQACMDHDRSKGEGVNPQEYTLIKILVKEKSGKLAAPELAEKKVFLVAATLRPETMYGQTNCFILPEGEYGVYATNNPDEVFVCSERSALGMAYQGLSPGWGEVKCYTKIMGAELLGVPLSAPNAQYETVYCLPLLTISMGKGTGVVTSVPSDAPDDYAALMDLRNKEALRAKFGITEDMLLDVVPVMEVPGFGNTSAVFACEKYKVKSQNDRAKLDKAKADCYKHGFASGVMLVGSQTGKPVTEAKPIVKQEMIDSGDAALYYEPESEVVGRQGDQCVVAQLDQWYLKYGEEEWKKKVMDFVKSDQFNAYTGLAQSQFEQTLDWLGEWACSRSFGLGTRLPWDTQFVIESLSDSTIYYAFYTIAHYLQGEGNLDGTKDSPAGIKPEDMNDAVWDFLFMNGPVPQGATIDTATLEKMKQEFNYWYPINLRVSGKDLIKNHLTMSLYNHAAIWDKDASMMPRSFFTNGWMVIDNEKMSKSTGNFLVLEESCVGDYYHPKTGVPMSWTTDSVRFTLSCAGDGLEDANFDTKVANAAVLELFNESKWIASILEDTKAGKLRTGGPDTYTFMDKVLANALASMVVQSYHAYEAMRFRDVTKFAYYSLRKYRDLYRDSFSRTGEMMHGDLLRHVIQVQTIVLSPIIPHFCEHVWQEHLGNTTSVLRAEWPKELHSTLDPTLMDMASYLFDNRSVFLSQKTKAKGTPTTGTVYFSKVVPTWKKAVLAFLKDQFLENGETFPIQKGPENGAFMKKIGAFAKASPDILAGKESGLAMKTAAFHMELAVEHGASALNWELAFDEELLLNEQKEYLRQSLELETLNIQDVATADPASIKNLGAVEPGKPRFALA